MSVYLSCVVRMMMITHIFAVSTKVMLCHCNDGKFFLGCLTDSKNMLGILLFQPKVVND